MTTDTVYTDTYLIERLAQDDQAAFETLYERYFARLFNYAVEKTGDRFLAQEVVQELFINLWQQRTRLALPGSVGAYIFTAAKNLIIDQYRQQVTRTRHHDVFIGRQPLMANQIEEQIRADDLQQMYERVLNQLPDKCRHIFALSRQAYSNREIALMEGIAEKTVEQHITKALRLLRDHLPNHLTALLIFSLLS